MNGGALKVVRPLVVSPAMLLASNVPETDYPAWSAGVSYAVGSRVVVAAESKVFESVTAGNVGHPPASSLEHWVRVGVTNRWKAFDDSVSTQTKQAGHISYRIKPGQVVHSVAALNLRGASSIRVRMVDPTLGVIYDTTTVLAGQMLVSTWWDWFFGERTDPRQSIHTDLPAAPAADVLIDLYGNDELAVGVLVVGAMRTFALAVKKGARVGFTDYSRKDRNDWGDTIVVERPFADRVTFPLYLRASEVDALLRFTKGVRAVPCVWIGSDRFEATTIYGFCKAFDIVLSYHDYSDCDIELEGLT